MMINIDNIFSLFAPKDGEQNGENTVYIDFTNTPVYWVGMYKKIVLHHFSYGEKTSQFFQNVDKSLDIIDVYKAGEWVAYTRAWHYIQHIDVKNELHCDAIVQMYKMDDYLEVALKLGIKFFEEKELYERCALLKKILDKIEEVNLSLEA